MQNHLVSAHSTATSTRVFTAVCRIFGLNSFTLCRYKMYGGEGRYLSQKQVYGSSVVARSLLITLPRNFFRITSFQNNELKAPCFHIVAQTTPGGGPPATSLPGRRKGHQSQAPSRPQLYIMWPAGSRDRSNEPGEATIRACRRRAGIGAPRLAHRYGQSHRKAVRAPHRAR